jgi:hypothetical protein
VNRNGNRNRKEKGGGYVVCPVEFYGMSTHVE